MGDSESRYGNRWRTLRSGRVARVALAYAAAGWLLVQVVSTMLMPLGLPDWALRTHYNAACTAMLSDDHEAALDLLERAIALGWSNARWILNDNDLVPLHDHPRFKQIVARLA